MKTSKRFKDHFGGSCVRQDSNLRLCHAVYKVTQIFDNVHHCTTDALNEQTDEDSEGSCVSVAPLTEISWAEKPSDCQISLIPAPPPHSILAPLAPFSLCCADRSVKMGKTTLEMKVTGAGMVSGPEWYMVRLLYAICGDPLAHIALFSLLYSNLTLVHYLSVTPCGTILQQAGHSARRLKSCSNQTLSIKCDTSWCP